jgi:hypothetical protein
MTTPDDDSTQGRIIFNDEERNTIMRSVFEADDKAERREALVELLIDLRQHIGEHGEGWQQVYLELHRLIEWLFKGSETYDLALELYEQRFHLRGGIEPSEVLRMVMDAHLSPTLRSESGWPVMVAAEPGSPFSPEHYKKRLEVAQAAILGIDTQRINCMHSCLKADAATLARVLSVLE